MIKGHKMIKSHFAPSFYLSNMLNNLQRVRSTPQSIGISCQPELWSRKLIWRQQIQGSPHKISDLGVFRKNQWNRRQK
jgi:hypothetical protein